MKGILRGITGITFLVIGVFGFVQAQTSALKTIIVDPGHGLPDPGARGHYGL